MRLVIFHYHLLPGGVTGVISEMAKAVMPRLERIESVALVCGSPENADVVREDVRSTTGIERIGVEVVGELGYVSETRSHDKSLTERIVHTLTTRFSGNDTVWWVHNYHLGKNPYFTEALLQIADRDRAQRIVFHIHDFPECARYENLRFIRDTVTREIYPQSENVRYAVINARDQRLLLQAGIARNLVFLLQNPVAVDAGERGLGELSAERRRDIREILADAFRTEFPLFRPTQKMLLYPIRTIRRKNVMEAGLLTRLAGDDAALVVTLPGVSEQERKYSAMVEQSYHEGLVPGLWGVGRRIDELGISFSELTATADVIVSSSVQEGFGYQFINALTWGHPLFARYLDVLDGIMPVFRGYPHDFYTRVMVPFESPSLSSMRAYLRMRYGEQISRIGRFLSHDETEALQNDIDAMLTEEHIDFSYLAPQMQYTILKDLADPGYGRLVTALNAESVASLRRVMAEDPEREPGRVDQTFGYDAFAAGVAAILDSFDAGPAIPHRGSQAHEVQASLVRSFARREYARLLYA